MLDDATEWERNAAARLWIAGTSLLFFGCVLLAAALFVGCAEDRPQRLEVAVVAADGLTVHGGPCAGAAPRLDCTRAECIAPVVRALRVALAAYAVDVVTVPTGPHDTVVLTSAGGDWCGIDRLAGISDLTGELIRSSGTAYVFGAGAWPNMDGMRAVHEFGHLCGLEHTSDANDVMSPWGAAQDGYSGVDEPTLTGEFRPMQNAAAMLMERLGSR